MAAAEIVSANLFAAEKYRGFIRETNPRHARHLSRHHVGAGIVLRDDLDGSPQHLFVATGMVAMLVGVEDIFDRFGGDRFDLRHDVCVVALEFVVDNDDAFIGDVVSDVTAIADDHVEVVLYLFERQLSRGLRRLCPGHPRARRKQNSNSTKQQGGFAHWGSIPVFRYPESVVIGVEVPGTVSGQC